MAFNNQKTTWHQGFKKDVATIPNVPARILLGGFKLFACLFRFFKKWRNVDK